MRRALSLLAGALLIAASAVPLAARVSPHETVRAVISGDAVMIVYGRPYTKDPTTGEARTIWGGVIPYGQIWRLGADEATLLITQKTITLETNGELTLPPGVYSLYALPASADSFRLIVNRQFGQWGLEYHSNQDIGRIPTTHAALTPPLHEFTITIEKAKTPATGLIRFQWEDSQYLVPFQVAK